MHNLLYGVSRGGYSERRERKRGVDENENKVFFPPTTASLRFDGALSVYINEFQTNVATYSQMNFMLISSFTAISTGKAYHGRFLCRREHGFRVCACGLDGEV